MAEEFLHIGKACRIIRVLKRMTQEDIFQITGLERSYISRFEADKIKKPRLTTVVKIAFALGVEVNDIIKVAKELKS